MNEARRPQEGGPLMRLVQIASALGASRVADEAFELSDRVSGGRFFCACVGQYKRGKSTFLNALIGEPILPVGVVPVTSAITVVLHGSGGRRECASWTATSSRSPPASCATTWRRRRTRATPSRWR